MHEYIDCDFKGTHDCNKNLTFSFEVLMRVYMQSVATEQIIWIFIERLTSSMGGGFLSSMYINQRYATSTNTKHTTPCQRANHDFYFFLYFFFIYTQCKIWLICACICIFVLKPEFNSACISVKSCQNNNKEMFSFILENPSHERAFHYKPLNSDIPK